MTYSSTYHHSRSGYASLVVRSGPNAIPSVQQNDDGTPKGHLAAVAEVRTTAEGGSMLFVGLGAAATRVTGTGIPARYKTLPADTLRGTHPMLTGVPRLFSIEERVDRLGNTDPGFVSVRLRRDEPTAPVGRFEAVVGTVLTLTSIGASPQNISTQRLVGRTLHPTSGLVFEENQEIVGAHIKFPPTRHNIAVATTNEDVLHFAGVEAIDVVRAGVWAAVAAATSVPPEEPIHHAVLPGFGGQIAENF